MNRKSRWRRALLILVGLVVFALAVRMVIRFADAQIDYSDETIEVELIPPQAPSPAAPTRERPVTGNPAA